MERRSENRPLLSPQCDPANGETKPTVHCPLGLSVGYADAGTKRLPVRPHTGLTATWLGQIQRLNLPRIATPQVSQLWRSARGSLHGSCKKKGWTALGEKTPKPPSRQETW